MNTRGSNSIMNLICRHRTLQGCALYCCCSRTESESAPAIVAVDNSASSRSIIEWDCASRLLRIDVEHAERGDQREYFLQLAPGRRASFTSLDGQPPAAEWT